MKYYRIKKNFSFCYHNCSLSDAPFLRDVSSVLDLIPHNSHLDCAIHFLKVYTIFNFHCFHQAIKILAISEIKRRNKPLERFKSNLE